MLAHRLQRWPNIKTTLVEPYSAGIDLRRQKLTSVDVRFFWRLKSIPALCENESKSLTKTFMRISNWKKHVCLPRFSLKISALQGLNVTCLLGCPLPPRHYSAGNDHNSNTRGIWMRTSSRAGDIDPDASEPSVNHLITEPRVPQSPRVPISCREHLWCIFNRRVHDLLIDVFSLQITWNTATCEVRPYGCTSQVAVVHTFLQITLYDTPNHSLGNYII